MKGVRVHSSHCDHFINQRFLIKSVILAHRDALGRAWRNSWLNHAVLPFAFRLAWNTGCAPIRLHPTLNAIRQKKKVPTRIGNAVAQCFGGKALANALSSWTKGCTAYNKSRLHGVRMSCCEPRCSQKRATGSISHMPYTGSFVFIFLSTRCMQVIPMTAAKLSSKQTQRCRVLG